MSNLIQINDLRQSAYDETDNPTPEYSQEEIIAAMRANCIERRDLLTQSLELADYRADMDDDERHSVRVALFLRIEDMQREWDALHEQLQAIDAPIEPLSASDAHPLLARESDTIVAESHDTAHLDGVEAMLHALRDEDEAMEAVA